jgi:hypothetical protein
LVVTDNVVPTFPDSFHYNDGGERLLRNVDPNKSHTASHPRKRHSSVGFPFTLKIEATISLESLADIKNNILVFPKKQDCYIGNHCTARSENLHNFCFRPDIDWAIKLTIEGVHVTSMRAAKRVQIVVGKIEG